jgi:hypothetical protein
VCRRRVSGSRTMGRCCVAGFGRAVCPRRRHPVKRLLG